MTGKEHISLWIPSAELDDLKSRLPLTDIKELDNSLVRAVLTNPGHLGGTKLRKTHITVELGYFMTEEEDISGAYGKISKKQGHSMYPNGLMFTSYDANDVRYHLKTRTVTERDGIPRLEVSVSDNGQDLDGFVAAAHGAYESFGRKRTERENHLLFYRPIHVEQQVATA